MLHVWYHEGYWYSAPEPAFEVPAFEPSFDFVPRNEQMIRDMRWSMRICPPPMKPFIVTGI